MIYLYIIYISIYIYIYTQVESFFSDVDILEQKCSIYIKENHTIFDGVLIITLRCEVLLKMRLFRFTPKISSKVPFTHCYTISHAVRKLGAAGLSFPWDEALSVWQNQIHIIRSLSDNIHSPVEAEFKLIYVNHMFPVVWWLGANVLTRG